MPAVRAPVASNQIAGVFLGLIGTPYRWGGASLQTGCDCSGLLNCGLGEKLGMTLPGGIKNFTFKAHGHGPVVTSYATWIKARTILQPEAGDLCIWVGAGTRGHIGVAVSPTEMVSALNSALGTIKTPIRGTGPAGSPLIFRRITGAGGSAAGCLAAPATLIWSLGRLAWSR